MTGQERQRHEPCSSTCKAPRPISTRPCEVKLNGLPQTAFPMWTGTGSSERGGPAIQRRCRRQRGDPPAGCLFGLGSLTDADRDELALAWEKLQAWPDVLPGLTRLKRRFTLATLSNADVAAVVNLSKHAGLQWDAVFTAEMARAFKPDPAVYRLAATYLGVPLVDTMMVASHKYDLRAAARLGCQSAFVARPLELGVGGAVDIAYEDEFDINASDFTDLADQLGC
jgi:2-haloacid dehalogenase